LKKGIKFKLAETAIFLGLISTIFISTCVGFQKDCDNIRDNVLRLHIIANSDTTFDQDLKIKIRDALLNERNALFEGSVDVNDAQKTAEEEKDKLISVARKTLSENNADYSVKIEVNKSYFPTRTYENITLPAGEYMAVKVILGEGKGHNWWCVMFPPLCLNAAENKSKLDDVLNKKSIAIVEKNPKYEIRFKIVEWYENIKEKIATK